MLVDKLASHDWRVLWFGGLVERRPSRTRKSGKCSRTVLPKTYGGLRFLAFSHRGTKLVLFFILSHLVSSPQILQSIPITHHHHFILFHFHHSLHPIHFRRIFFFFLHFLVFPRAMCATTRAGRSSIGHSAQFPVFDAVTKDGE
jgi:hypothetical protein